MPVQTAKMTLEATIASAAITSDQELNKAAEASYNKTIMMKPSEQMEEISQSSDTLSDSRRTSYVISELDEPTIPSLITSQDAH